MDQDRPVGAPVPGWAGATPPSRAALRGRYVVLEPLDPERHEDGLHAALHTDDDPWLWHYLPYGPFEDRAAWRAFLDAAAAREDPLMYVLADPADGTPRGMGAYLRIDAPNGTIEIGFLAFGSAIQRTPATTEAVYLWARNAFDELGYRRFEWKCDALNARSRAAAERFGFRYEGTFEQHMVVKGRNRDTAWFVITDRRWPAVRAAFEQWLAPENFGADGRQRDALAALRHE